MENPKGWQKDLAAVNCAINSEETRHHERMKELLGELLTISETFFRARGVNTGENIKVRRSYGKEERARVIGYGFYNLGKERKLTVQVHPVTNDGVPARNRRTYSVFVHQIDPLYLKGGSDG